MNKRLLILDENSEKRQLRLAEVFDQSSYHGVYRISPIFQVTSQRSVPDLSQTHYVGFFYPVKSFTMIGSAAAGKTLPTSASAWFSHGLASLVVFTQSREQLETFQQVIIGEIRASEWWLVQAHEIEVVRKFRCKPEVVDHSEFRVADYSELSFDLKTTLDEFVHALNIAVALAAQYAPVQLTTFRRLAQSVNSMIGELLYFEASAGSPVPVAIAAKAGHDVMTPVDRLTRVHLRHDQLVQINSALAYLVTQGYSGTVPILENVCPIQRYSLLGIGTAYFALAALAQSVEKTFEQFPIDTIVAQKYDTTVGIPVFQHLEEFDPSKWKRAECQMDTHLKGGVLQCEHRPKLVYYSGRQGFRETKCSVTAPPHMIAAASHARWSPLTLTHELLHGHVDALLAAIFTHGSDGFSSAGKAQAYADLKADLERTPPTTTPNLKRCLRSIVLNYCLQADSYSSFASDSIRNDPSLENPRVQFGVPSAEIVWDSLRRHYKQISEIMVHVLDYHYIYNCDQQLYLSLLWESWTAVPAVLQHVEAYLIRSVVAIGSAETGTLTERFDIALKTVRSTLELMLKRDTANVVVTKARQLIDDTTTVTRMRLQFKPAMYLADVTLNCLYSTQIFAAIMRDDLRDLSKESPIYRLETGSFTGDQVTSPVALCADMLRRNLSGETERFDPETVSAWMLLACASAMN